MIFGYLDAGSGSLILQAVIGGATGIAVAVRALRHKYRFGRGKTETDSGDDDTAEETSLPAES